MTFDWKAHPLASSINDGDKDTSRNDKKRIKREIEDVLFDAFISKGVLLVKGRWFLAEQLTEDVNVLQDENGQKDEEEEEGLFFRATFAAAQEDPMKEGIKRVGEALREEFKL